MRSERHSNSNSHQGRPSHSNSRCSSTASSLPSQRSRVSQASQPNQPRESQSSNQQTTIALFGAGSKTATHFLRLALDAGYHVRALLIQQSQSQLQLQSQLQSQYSAAAQDQNTEASAAVIAKALREEFDDQSALHWVRADSVYDARACQRVLRGADYVVCMMNESPLAYDSNDFHADESKEAKKDAKKHAKNGRGSFQKDRTSMTMCSDTSKPITSFIKILYPLMLQQATIQVFLYQVISVMLVYPSICSVRCFSYTLL
jgi:hypothetical protein